MSLSNMINKLSGQPDSYDKKNSYTFSKTLGAGTYGIVRLATQNGHQYAIKIILKKSVKGNEQMVYDELEMLQKMKHEHIVRFHDWFESRDKYYIVTQLATGGELFDRICEYGKFTEKDASQTIRQVLSAVDYLHYNNVVHRDLKPENLLYLTKAHDSPIVLADFGIAKMLETKDEVLTTMAGSFGYAAPEVMKKMGHGKPVDMWSLGVITYTLLCGYSPFRSENLHDLIQECDSGHVVFHERYWKDVSADAKDFIKHLLRPKPEDRLDSVQAMGHRWLTGTTATEHDILPDLRAYLSRAKLRAGIDAIRLTKRIENLKQLTDDDEGDAQPDVPRDAKESLGQALGAKDGVPRGLNTTGGSGKGKLSRAARSAIFKEVVLAKVRAMKDEKEKEAKTSSTLSAHK